MKKIYLIIIALSLCGLFLFSFEKTFAVQIGSGNAQITIQDPEVKYKNMGDIVKMVFDTVITIAQIAFIILFLVGGIMYLTSAGNEEQSDKARKLLIDAIVGLVIVLSAWAVSNWIIGALKDGKTGIDGGQGSSQTQQQQGGNSLPDPTQIITNEPTIYNPEIPA